MHSSTIRSHARKNIGRRVRLLGTIKIKNMRYGTIIAVHIAKSTPYFDLQRDDGVKLTNVLESSFRYLSD